MPIHHLVSPSTAKKKRRTGEPVVYDFTAPPRLARDQSRLFEVSLETFARQWTTQLSSRLPCHVSVTFTDIHQKTYDTYVQDLETPSVLMVYSNESFGTGVLSFSVECALTHLDYALGGSGGEQPHRTLTDIEISLTLRMCEKALEATKYSFAAFLPDELIIEATKQDPQLLGVGRANDMIVIAEFTLLLGESEFPIEFMMPLGPLQERLEKATTPDASLTTEEIRRSALAAQAMNHSIPTVPVDVALRLSPIRVDPEVVMELTVGDFLPIAHGRSKPLEIAAENNVVAHGVPTRVGKRRACLVTHLEENPDE